MYSLWAITQARFLVSQDERLHLETELRRAREENARLRYAVRSYEVAKVPIGPRDRR